MFKKTALFWNGGFPNCFKYYRVTNVLQAAAHNNQLVHCQSLSWRSSHDHLQYSLHRRQVISSLVMSQCLHLLFMLLFMPEQLQPSDNSQLWFSIIFTNVKEFCDVIPLGPAYGVYWLPFVLTQFIFILTSLAILTHLKSWISIIYDRLRHWGSSFELEVSMFFFSFQLDQCFMCCDD